MKYLGLVLTALLPLSSHAAIYKCIIDDVPTFSQTPCSPDAETLNIKDDKSAKSNGVSDELLKQCSDLALKTGGWRDPHSFVVLSHEHQWRSDASGARQVLAMQVNAKNGYGGYGDSKPFNCFLNHNGTSLSSVQHWIN